MREGLKSDSLKLKQKNKIECTTSTYLIWLIVGVNANRKASAIIGRDTSLREAPKARYISILSRFSLNIKRKIGTRKALQLVEQNALKLS
jgi:hypothetical protein